MKKKNLVIAISVLLIAVLSVGATLAYFTAQTEPVTNVFTLGNVSATISEPTWNGDQLMMPGDTDLKDPTITLGATSQPAWVFMKVTVTDLQALQAAANPADLLAGIATNLAPVTWTLRKSDPSLATDTITYIYAYNTVLNAGQSTPPIFTAITLPTKVDGTAAYATLTDGFTITAQGYAIQAANVATIDAAWALATTQFGF